MVVGELDLLTALAERCDRIVSREELYRAVWEESYRKTDRSVDVYIARLRHKLDEALPGRPYIHTHFGFGYRLSHPFHTSATRG
jgi:DNA-binding response OmpR family regulator